MGCPRSSFDDRKQPGCATSCRVWKAARWNTRRAMLDPAGACLQRHHDEWLVFVDDAPCSSYEQSGGARKLRPAGGAAKNHLGHRPEAGAERLDGEDHRRSKTPASCTGTKRATSSTMLRTHSTRNALSAASPQRLRNVRRDRLSRAGQLNGAAQRDEQRRETSRRVDSGVRRDQRAARPRIIIRSRTRSLLRVAGVGSRPGYTVPVAATLRRSDL